MKPVRSRDASIPRVPPQKPSLRTEIARGWDWLVFVWQMLGRMGGLPGIVRTLWTVLGTLVKRTLVQWGLIK